MTDIAHLIEIWNKPEGHPYKGSLIDTSAWNGDDANPNLGCMCAQGQVLHLIGGMSPTDISRIEQGEADRTVAKQLGISRAHAVLLRQVNDTQDGAPAIVLTNPKKVIGEQAQTVLAFWRHLDRMSSEQWAAAWAAAGDAAGDAAWAAAGAAAGDAAGDAAWDAAWATAEIMGAAIMRERGQAFYFLPLFGFTDPEAALSADARYREGKPA